MFYDCLWSLCWCVCPFTKSGEFFATPQLYWTINQFFDLFSSMCRGRFEAMTLCLWSLWATCSTTTPFWIYKIWRILVLSDFGVMFGEFLGDTERAQARDRKRACASEREGASASERARASVRARTSASASTSARPNKILEWSHVFVLNYEPHAPPLTHLPSTKSWEFFRSPQLFIRAVQLHVQIDILLLSFSLSCVFPHKFCCWIFLDILIYRYPNLNIKEKENLSNGPFIKK